MTIYKVVDDNYGQRGTHIEEIKMTKKEYLRLSNIWGKGYSLFDKYSSALMYIQD